MARKTARPIPNRELCVEIKRGTNDWLNVIGAASVSVDGSEAPSTDLSDYFASYREYDIVPPPTISLGIPLMPILHQSTIDFQEVQESGEEISIRWSRDKTVTLWGPSPSGTTLAIATDGTITAAGTAGTHPNLATHKSIGPGHAFQIDGDEVSSVQQYRIIKTIPENGMPGGVVIQNNPTGSGVSADEYSVVIPPYQQPEFSVVVTNFSRGQEAGGVVAGTVSLAPLAAIPAMTFGTPS